MSSLDVYRKKRDFTKTPEPSGRVGKRTAKSLSFVIQKHAASHLHYDFRLELDGVLLSWAVPKGPSLDPRDKRLAMQTEDHPLEYGDFEGIIPARQYGGGTVIVWDRGEWVPKEDPREGYRKGRLKFSLRGEKLHGGWMLVRSHGGKYGGRDKRAWLLIKERDDEAREADESIVERRPESVLTARTLEDVARDASRVWQSTKSVAENVKAGAVAPLAKTSAARAAKKAAKAEQSAEKREAMPAGAKRAAIPDKMQAQLATLVDEAPSDAGWLHEIKYDGYRMLFRIDEGECEVWSRNGKAWTDAFPTIARAAAALPLRSAWIDGEVVMLGEGGTTSFQALQNTLADNAERSLVCFAFDLMYLDGYDLRAVPLVERKRLLEQLLDGNERIRYSGHFATDGRTMLAEACKLGLEGIICKREDAPYQATRGRSWLKVKCNKRQELVIGGFTEGQGSRAGFGALLLGVYEDDALRYAGKVGTGFDAAALTDLRAMLDKLRTDRPAFVNPPRGAEGRRATWVKPQLVAEIAFTEWTRDGTLRHPSFQGLRVDKRAKDVVREREAPVEEVAGDPAKPASSRAAAKATSAETTTAKTAKTTKTTKATKTVASAKHATADKAKVAKSPATSRIATSPAPAQTASVAGNAKSTAHAPSSVSRPPSGTKASLPTLAGVTISNPAKMLFPDVPLTKGELCAYYEAIAPLMLPHLKDRPLSLVRCPEGTRGKCFYQKHAKDTIPAWVDRVKVQDSDGPADYMMAQNAKSLVTLAQFGVIELHPWGSRKAKLEHPDRLIFDFDPDDALPWDEVKAAALLMRGLLDDLGLRSFLKTTGGKGLHVVVPVAPTMDWDIAKAFVRDVASILVRTFPDRYTTTISKAARPGKILIDYYRNAHGATAIAPYAVRARAGAPVSAPVDWSVLDGKQDIRFDHFSVRSLQALLDRDDPWKEMSSVRQTVTAALRKRVAA